MKSSYLNPACRYKMQGPRTQRGMVRHYTWHYRPWAQDELERFSNLPFGEAIERAALAKDERGKRFRTSYSVIPRRIRGSPLSAA